jgi:dienelactone hydrolase
MKKLIMTLSAAVITLTAAAAYAGTPIPDITEQKCDCKAVIIYHNAAADLAANQRGPKGLRQAVRQSLEIKGILIEDFRDFLFEVVSSDALEQAQANVIIQCVSGTVAINESIDWIADLGKEGL